MPTQSISTIKPHALPNIDYEKKVTDSSLLSQAAILEHISSEYRARIAGLHLKQTVNSTNTWMRELLQHQSAGLFQYSACLAECQTQGRGRMNRHWVSPFAKNIYLSLGVHLPLDADLHAAPVITGIACLRALKRLSISDVQLKWPNDLLFQGQKLAGILLETMSGNTQSLVLGVGMNVHMEQASAQQITQPWTDLNTILGKKPDRNRLSAYLIEEIIRAMDQYQQEGMAAFISEWREHDTCYGKEILLHDDSQQLTGKALGLDAEGNLKVDINGEIKSICYGEISLRLATPKAPSA